MNPRTHHARLTHPGHVRSMPVSRGLWDLRPLDEEGWVDRHEFMRRRPGLVSHQHLGKHGGQDAQRNGGRDPPIECCVGMRRCPKGRFNKRLLAAKDLELLFPCPAWSQLVQFIRAPESESFADGHGKRPDVCRRPRFGQAEGKLRGHEERCPNLVRTNCISLCSSNPEIPQVKIWERVPRAMVVQDVVGLDVQM